MTKLSKVLQKCPIFGPFCPNTNKSATSAKIRLLFLRCKSNITSLKKSEGS